MCAYRFSQDYHSKVRTSDIYFPRTKIDFHYHLLQWSGFITSIYIWSSYIWSILHLVNLTFGQLLHLGILHFVHFTFRQLIQFVNCDNGLKFGQLSYLKAWFPLSQLEYQLNKSANIGTQTSQQLKISVSSQIQHGKLGSC